jgi:hypothetical protein
MAYFHKCGPRKLIAGFPVLLATALITYISIIFIFEFLPYRFPTISFTRLLMELPFIYFSSMTIISIFQTAASDPGYLSLDYHYSM